MLVVDASAPADFLTATRHEAELKRLLVAGNLHAPDFVLVETASAFRGLTSAGKLSAADLDAAVADLLVTPMVLHPSAGLIRGALAPRPNITVYDAYYVVLALGLGCPLLTADRRLARAADHLVDVVVPGPIRGE